MSTVLGSYEELGLRPTESLYGSQDLEKYLQRAIKSRGFEFGIDCSADEGLYFHTIGYSLIAGHFIIYPLSKTAYPVFIQAMLMKGSDTEPNTLHSRDKYDNNLKEYPEVVENLCVLPGSNLIKSVTDKNILIKINEMDNVVAKIHPLTTDKDKDTLREIFSGSVVVDDEYPLQSLLTKTKTVYTTFASESSIRAVILGKDVVSIELDDTASYSMYSHFTRSLFCLPKEDRLSYLSRLVSSDISGFIPPDGESATEQIDKCLDYLKRMQDGASLKFS